MFAEHPRVNPPQDNAVLWRYMDFTKFVSLLDRRALYFSRADKLGDPFEGSLSHINRLTRPHWLTQIGVPEEIRDQILEEAPSILGMAPRLGVVNCWHENNYESEAMWKLYAGRQDGIAIKTTFEKLAGSLECEDEIYIGKVNYVDYGITLIPEGNFLRTLLTKRKSFEHEREIRAIAMNFPSPDQNIGRYFQVNLSTLIGEILVAPQTPEWFSELVNSIVTRYELQVPVRTSTLAAAPTW